MKTCLIFSIFEPVIKKYSITLLLYLAYTIVFAHSLVPHHHHDKEEESAQLLVHNDAGAHHHHSNDTDDDGSLAHEFESYIHSAGTDDIYQKNELKIDCSTIAALYITASFNYCIAAIERPLKVTGCSAPCIISIPQYYLSCKGLRAPPVV